MKKRSKSSELGDRLSELPDALILGILSLLPMRDVVRTTVLSKSWKGLWTSVPSLLFDADNKTSETFRSFVNRALLRWEGTVLRKFSLNIHCESLISIHDIHTWLHVATVKGVEELSLDFRGDVYSPPQSLYSCSTVRKASFLHCRLKIERNVQWDQLKSLRIEQRWLSNDVIEKVMLGAPQMENLALGFDEWSETLNIRSNSLKRLTIERNEHLDSMGSSMILSIFSIVRIWTPNVEALEISGISLQGNVSSLTRAKVGFANPYMYGVLKGMAENFFRNILQLEKVTLTSWSIKALREIKNENKHIVGPLSNVKLLKLYATHVDDVVDILELFPMLTVLVLLQEPETYKGLQFFEIACPSTTTCISEFDAERSLEPKSDFLMPYLTTIEITWAAYDNSIFPLIEILLKNVRKLEKMVLCITDSKSGAPAMPLLASQKLLSMQKAFPAADVIIMCQD